MGGERGFTLLEVLIAFIIAGLALGALTRGAAGGLQSARVAGHYEEALSRARSRMATLGVGMQPGEQRGDDGGGFSWRVAVTPVATGERARGEAARAKRAVLYAVVVGVSWELDGGRREVVLSTERVGEAAEEP